MKKWNAVFAALLAAAAGCVDFQYSGQEFEPTPVSAPVTYYPERASLPRGQYGIIGKATIIAPQGTDGYDIQELLLTRAREYGADAVCLVKANDIRVGTYFFSSDEFVSPKAYKQPAGEQNAAWSTPVEIRGEQRNRHKVKVKALFLKKKEALAKILEERGSENRIIEPEAVEPEEEPAQSVENGADAAGEEQGGSSVTEENE